MLESLKALLQEPPPSMPFEITEAGIAAARIGARAELSSQPLKTGGLSVFRLKEKVNNTQECVAGSWRAAGGVGREGGRGGVAELAGRVLWGVVRDQGSVRLVRCLELPATDLEDVAAVLRPTFGFSEDNLGGRAERLLLCGFGERTDEAQRRFQEELGVEAEPMRSPLGTPGENNAGLLGYLRSIAKNN